MTSWHHVMRKSVASSILNVFLNKSSYAVLVGYKSPFTFALFLHSTHFNPPTKMESKLCQLAAVSRVTKRKLQRVEEALLTLKSLSISELSEVGLDCSDDFYTLLCAKLGWSATFILGRLTSSLPKVLPQDLEEKILTGLSMEFGSVITKKEFRAIEELFRKFNAIQRFSYDEHIDAVSKKAGFPLHRILCPPHRSMLVVWLEFVANITLFDRETIVPGIKFLLRCQNCKVNYGYSMYGNTENGYKFYQEKRPYVEASNVTYLSRGLCLDQIHLA